ncbi:EH signature domain-containing protein [Sphingobium aromaticivastans]|uniref:EH signature domain-containing protein n=1 Tax=Sphingobium aromaticivastans TaxID=1778665 RepID=UPI003018D305
MSGLREVAEQLAKIVRLPLPTTDRKTACEKAADRLADLEGRAIGPGERWADFLKRVGGVGVDPRALSRRDLRRMVGELWPYEGCDGFAPAALDAAVGANAKSLDRSVLTAYLRHFPLEHPSFEALRAASALTAERHDWPWRSRGERWRLWDADAGPARLAKALLESDDPVAVLREAGLDGDLAQGGFVTDAVEAACEQAGSARGEQAQAIGARLIVLFDRLAIGGMEAMLAWALLTPWVGTSPDRTYRKKLVRLLVDRIGDPRMDAARWQAVLADLPDGEGSVDILTLLKRWLTDLTVREFFRVVAHTTDDPVQWGQREAFWLGYLDAGLIDEAWFALGTRAEQMIRPKQQEKGVDYGTITGDRQYADPSHSALILSIGSMRLAEWSHSGACRFWRAEDRTAPIPYQKQYFGYQLRAMNGDPFFEYISHHGGWQQRFAKRISTRSGRLHPKYGEGHGW